MLRYRLFTSVVAALTWLVAPRAECVPCAGLGEDGTLLLVGTPTRQRIELTWTPVRSVVSADCNGDGDYLDAAAGDLNAMTLDGVVKAVDARLGGGGDSITILLSDDTTPGDFSNLTLTAVLGGGGANTLQVVANATTTIVPGSRWTFDVRGGVGPDQAAIGLSKVVFDASSFALKADMGLGNDTLVVDVPGGRNAAGLALDASLGPGTNVLRVAEGADLTNGASLRIDVAGDAGPDAVTFDWSGLLAGRATAWVDLGAGNDKFVSNFDLDSFEVTPSNGELHLTAAGGLGNDVITVGRNGTSHAGGALDGGILDLGLSGGPGNDAITVDFGDAGILFTGIGLERLRVDGGTGSDTIGVTLAAATSGRHDIAITGGAQADTVRYSQTLAGTTDVWVGPAALVDGGSGTPDVCVVTSNGPVRRRNCER
jgi:hypothetical protein